MSSLLRHLEVGVNISKSFTFPRAPNDNKLIHSCTRSLRQQSVAAMASSSVNTNASMQYENGTVVNFNSSAVVTPVPTNPPGVLPSKITTTSKKDTCGCDATHHTPRTCYDCLNTLLLSGERVRLQSIIVCILQLPTHTLRIDKLSPWQWTVSRHAAWSLHE